MIQFLISIVINIILAVGWFSLGKTRGTFLEKRRMLLRGKDLMETIKTDEPHHIDYYTAIMDLLDINK